MILWRNYCNSRDEIVQCSYNLTKQIIFQGGILMKKLGLIPKIVIAIILGFIFGRYLPVSFCRVFVTFSSILGNFLNFAIPLIIIGFIVAEIGRASCRE